MFDPGRNLLTLILAGAIGVLTVGAGVQWLVLGRADADRIQPAEAGQAPQMTVAAPDIGLDELSTYSAITDRPVFFADRRLPVIEVPADFDAAAEVASEPEPEPEPVAEIQAQVAGIVITPEMRLAMINDQKAGKTLVLSEGMTLEGDQGAWRLDRIAPRMAYFVADDGQQAALELKVHTAGLTVGTPPPARRRAEQPTEQPRRAAAEATAEEEEVAARPDDDEARARAEEVRRRVAERRAELRAEAARRARQEQQRRENND